MADHRSIERKEDAEVFDYVVVGAGSAGCVLAARLSEDAGVRVLLLEAGGSDRRLLVRVPAAMSHLWFDPKVNWGYVTEPEPGLLGRRIPIPRGRILGGTSSINGMMAVRGQPEDYDRWRDLGLSGWGYADVLPYFQRSESHWRGVGPFHGADGPVPVNPHAAPSPVGRAAEKAAEAMGFPLTDDFNGPQPQGFGLPDFTIAGGRRASTASAYLDGARHRRNLAVRSHATAQRVLFEDHRATGVEYVQDGAVRVVRARREVVVCGGALNSPQLLMLSGVGPAEQLRRFGIRVIADIPAVGQNLCEHPGVSFDVAFTRPLGFDSELRLDRFGFAALRWLITGRGSLASPPMIVSANVSTEPGSNRADMHMLLVPSAFDARLWFPGVRRARGHVMMASCSLNYPRSRGEVRLASADPKDKPSIRYNLFGEADDMKDLVRGYKVLRALTKQAPLADVLGPMVRPDREPTTDAEIEGYLRANAATAFHPAGTCRMGADDASVVDGALRVRGTDGLRVVDASIFPDLPGGNTNLPVIMAAEKAADMVRGRPAPPPIDPRLCAPVALQGAAAQELVR